MLFKWSLSVVAQEASIGDSKIDSKEIIQEITSIVWSCRQNFEYSYVLTFLDITRKQWLVCTFGPYKDISIALCNLNHTYGATMCLKVLSRSTCDGYFTPRGSQIALEESSNATHAHHFLWETVWVAGGDWIIMGLWRNLCSSFSSIPGEETLMGQFHVVVSAIVSKATARVQPVLGLLYK